MEEEKAVAPEEATRKTRRTEEPDEDVNGDRFCLDCGVVIPKERVETVDAVRCFMCSCVKERYFKEAERRGGFNLEKHIAAARERARKSPRR